MPTSGDFPHKFSKGERLKADDLNQLAGQVHRLASVGDAQSVISIGGGTFRREKRHPPQIRDAVLTSAMPAAGNGAPEDDKSDFKFKFLYPDKDDADLLVEGNEEQDGVNRDANLTGSVGDYVAVAKMGVEWRALGGGGAGGTTITDGCECNKQLYAEGVPLDGTPTICCSSHKRWTIDLGPVIGVKNLFHLSGDIWSTFNTDGSLDNPVTIECGSSLSDEYDVVLELTSTGAIITLEARAALNCDLVCFTYERALPFRCKGPNQFNLIRHEGVKDLDLPVCLCIKPRHYPECTTLECSTTAATVIIRGLPVLAAYDHECEPGEVDCGCHCDPNYSETEIVPRTDPMESQCGLNDCITFKKIIGSATLQNSECCIPSGGCAVTVDDIILWCCVTSNGNVEVRLNALGGGYRWRKTTGSPHPCSQEITLNPTAGSWPSSSCSGLELASMDPITVEFVGAGLPSQSGHCAECGA